MTVTDGRVLGAQAVVLNGPSELLLNIVLVSEGFQERDLPEFAQYAQRFADRLFATAPFNEACFGINIFRVDIASTHTGADDPIECGGSGRTAATYFDGSFCAHGVRRAISVDEGSVINVVGRFVPQWHLIIVLVNSQIWGGTGGQIAKSSVPPGWEAIAIHEMGHTLFGLGDEYEFLQGCNSGETDRNEWPSFLGIRFEPAEPNITIWEDRNGLKWRDLVSESTDIPTKRHDPEDCTACDSQPSPVPPGTVGTFEGAGTYHCKVYRPEFNCMMRVAGLPFCAVCRRHIKKTIDAYHLIGVSYAPLRFVRINDYAVANGYVGGYPNFHQADYGQGLVFGSILIKAGVADWRDVPAAQLGNPSGLEQRFTAANDYAVANGYVGGYPNFHQADYGQGLVYGCVLIKAGSADWRDVPAAQLGNPSGFGQRFTAVNDYAVANGYVGGYPNFHQADYGQRLVYGCVLIKAGSADWRDVPIRDLCAQQSRRLNDAQFVSQTVPRVMRAGQSQSITVTMRNTGVSTWNGSYRLGSQDPQDNFLWGLHRVSIPTTDVLPGQAVSFSINVTAPGSPGVYNMQWRMVQELVEWFGDFTPNVTIRVNAGLTTVPDVRNMARSAAASKIRAADLQPRFTGFRGSFAWVITQSPSGGTTVNRGSIVTLRLEEGPIPIDP